MQKKNINLITAMIGSLALSACSNVSSEWDCPKQNGVGCINIEAADRIATEKLETSSVRDIQPKQHTSVKHREVWFAPYTDKKGQSYDASIVVYGD